MAINVLVSFGTENRVVTVTSPTSITASIRSIFRIPTDYTVNLQRYSKEWEDWVTINPEELENRDKVRVTTSVSVDFTSTSKGLEETLGDYSLFEPTDSSNSQEDAPQSSQSDQNSDVKTVAERVKVELKPWPMQVKIPVENMSPPLRITLESGVFPCDKLRKQLIQVLYDYMWQFGSHPTRFHYEQVAQQLVSEFPCLAQTKVPSAKPYDYWKMKLSDKFRNERKNRPVHGQTTERKAKVQKTSSGRLVPQSEQPGEDPESIAMHIKWMQQESRKQSPDWKKAQGLMQVTFLTRRDDVNKKMMVREVKEKYPFLFSAAEIHREFKRTTGVLGLETLTKSLKSFVEAIIRYPFKEETAEKILQLTMTKCEEATTMDKAEETKLLAALYLVPHLFKKKSSLMMGFEPKEDDMSPYLLFRSDKEDIFSITEYEVISERENIATCKTMQEGIALLIESYWAFDMVYPKAIKDTCNFIECALLKMKAVKPTRSVTTVIAKLEALA